MRGLAPLQSAKLALLDFSFLTTAFMQEIELCDMNQKKHETLNPKIPLKTTSNQFTIASTALDVFSYFPP